MQQLAYSRYQRANTEATLSTTTNVFSLSKPFVDFINEWRPIHPSTVEVPLQNQNYTWEQFFKMCCSTTFHTVWGNYGAEPSYGSGNVLLVQLLQNDDDTLILSYNGFNEHHSFNFNSSSLTSLSSRSMVLESGNLKMIIKVLSSRLYGVPIFNHQLEKGGTLYANYFMVPISFP